MTIPLHVLPDVADALAEGAPVVALESTIISHGMPYPDNLTMAQRVEEAVRDGGAVPATIAVLDGALCIGLTPSQLGALAQADAVAKLSRADLAICLTRGTPGATTVAATMIGARLAGIPVFATGGIGGVHRGAEQTFAISAALRALSETPVTVVCAGAKSILDVPKTLEVLETLGVPVITYGADDFPAFWARTAGLPSPQRMDSAGDIAAAHLMRQALGVPGGQLVANPIPVADEISQSVIEPIIERAVKEANDAGIVAKEVTPYLLSRIVDLTEGQSLTANIALVRNNARLAAQIASEIT
mgnify:CR=1 FL=1